MRDFAGFLFATTVVLLIVPGISTSTAAYDTGAEAAIVIVSAGPPYGCGVGNGPPGHGHPGNGPSNGKPGIGHAGNPPGCRGVAVPPANNPRQGIIERLQSEPSAQIRLAIRQCVNAMRGNGWRERYESCYYPSLTN